MGEFVGLECEAETLRAIAAGLARFGPAEGAPEWLVSGVWLCTGDADYLATASAEVLGNGYVARPLNIHPPGELVQQVRDELPDLSSRLIGRSGVGDLPECVPTPPESLRSWPAGPYSTKVLIRVSQRHSATTRVACALLVESEAKLLLVGTDPSTLAMVLSEDPALIARYRESREALAVDQYLDRLGS